MSCWAKLAMTCIFARVVGETAVRLATACFRSDEASRRNLSDQDLPQGRRRGSSARRRRPWGHVGFRADAGDVVHGPLPMVAAGLGGPNLRMVQPDSAVFPLGGQYQRIMLFDGGDLLPKWQLVLQKQGLLFGVVLVPDDIAGSRAGISNSLYFTSVMSSP